jgi:hypothetical protein
LRAKILLFRYFNHINTVYIFNNSFLLYNLDVRIVPARRQQDAGEILQCANCADNASLIDGRPEMNKAAAPPGDRLAE